MKIKMSASILSIGDELLIGQVVNTNASWLSSALVEEGISIHRHLSVADQEDEIIAGLDHLSEHASLLFITGGLGPTKDDITKVAIAHYFNDQLSFHQDTFDRLSFIMTRFGRSVKESQSAQCYLPSKAIILPNDRGTAPCLYLIQAGVHYFFMPGVPFEMKHLFYDRILPILQSKGLIVKSLHHTTILTAGIGEATLEEKIENIVDEFPSGLSISYLPGKAQVRLRLTANDISVDQLSSFKHQIINRLGSSVFGSAHQTLESVIGKLLIDQKLTVGCAESCTGGAISAQITSVSGSSQYFKGSIISYANSVKIQNLNVQPSTLDNYGAVSEQVVAQMVKGAREALHVDVAVAISGIAGPTGDTPDKPVGTVYIGVGDQYNTTIKRFVATKNRMTNIAYFTSYALNLLRLFLNEKCGNSSDTD